MKIEIGNKSLSELTAKNIIDIAIIEGHTPHLDYWNKPKLIEFDNKMFSDTIVIDFLATRKSDGIKSEIYSFFFCFTRMRMHSTNELREKRNIPPTSNSVGMETLRYLIKEGFNVPLY